MDIDLALGVQELDASTRGAVHDGVVFAFLTITKIVERSRGRYRGVGGSPLRVARHIVGVFGSRGVSP